MNWMLSIPAVFLARAGRPVLDRLRNVGGSAQLFARTLYWVFIGPFTGRTRFRRQVFPLMQQIGVRSLFIVCLVSFLIGAILVLQTADQFERFGSKHFVAPTVCIAVIRELGPLMTAIVIAGRVGAAFTAGIGSMVINEEVLALRTMGINPIGYLVAPRLIAIGIMLPCLTAFSYIMGLLGGLTAAVYQFHIPSAEYIISTEKYIHLTDMSWGLIKAAVFASLICMVACRNALSVRGGPEGVGRNTMISVVTSLVSIIVADAVIGTFLSSVVYPS